MRVLAEKPFQINGEALRDSEKPQAPSSDPR
jgi:hypothetical protein